MVMHQVNTQQKWNQHETKSNSVQQDHNAVYMNTTTGTRPE